MIDAAHYLQVYDPDLIFSWTPREFKNFIKGAQLRQIDIYETEAMSAIFNAKMKSKKRGVKLKDIYDADKSRKTLLSADKPKDNQPNMERYRKAQAAMKNYKSTPLRKGG